LLTLFSGTELRAQAGASAPPSFPNGGLLGENLFKAEPGTKTDKDREVDGWSIKPSNAERYASAGWACFYYSNDPDKYRKAVDYFMQSILCDQSNISAHIGRGVALMTLYRYQAALEDFDFVLSREPGRNELYPRRAFVRAMLADYEDVKGLRAAELDLERPRAANSDEATIRAARGVIASKRMDHAKAIVDLSWAVDHQYDIAPIRLCRGSAYAFLEDFPRAIADLEHVIQQEPSCVPVYLLLASCHAQTGKAEQALVDYANALKLQPENFEVLFDRISLALNIGKPEVALADLDCLADLHPDQPWTFFVRALVRWIDGKDIVLVKADADRAVELDPREWSFHAVRAAVDWKRAEYAKALGEMGRFALTLRRTEFKFSWEMERYGNGHGKFSLGVFWSYEGEDQKPNDGAKPADLDHKFADLGLKALWASGLSCFRVN